MNTFIPQNPIVVVLVNKEGDVIAAKTNIDPSLKIEVRWTELGFDHASENLPFSLPTN
jgi:hypothetical protein